MPTSKGRKPRAGSKNRNARRADPAHKQAERDKQARIKEAREKAAGEKKGK